MKVETLMNILKQVQENKCYLQSNIYVPKPPSLTIGGISEGEEGHWIGIDKDGNVIENSICDEPPDHPETNIIYIQIPSTQE